MKEEIELRRAERRSAKMILIIDNYDSFTYNLVQYFGELGTEIKVVRNDEWTVQDIEYIRPKAIVLSPGPGTPSDAGISLETVRYFAGKIPIFGVCLGHQTIAQAFGGKVVLAQQVMHGKTSEIHHDGQTIFTGLSSPMVTTRYHSWLVDKDSLPDEFAISAETKMGEIMAIRHRTYPIEGVQFHPESILTEHGKRLLGNFLNQYMS